MKAICHRQAWPVLLMALACSLLLPGSMAWNVLPKARIFSRFLSSPTCSRFLPISRGKAFQMCAPVEEESHTLETLVLPDARKGDCWRPTADDVDRISWGKPAKKKMTGSRGVPHRLNQEERMLYDMARRKGFLEMAGSGWRKQRRGAPLANTYRSWCDSQGVPGLILHKDKNGRDEVVLDLSPMRIPEEFPSMALSIASAEAGATIESFEGMIILPEEEEEVEGQELGNGGASDEEGPSMSAEATQEILAGDFAEYSVPLPCDVLSGAGVGCVAVRCQVERFENEPIYRLPMFVLSWEVERAEAKALAKRLAGRFKTMEPATKGKNPSKTLKRGMPQIKPGKSRRHGGYGIG